MQRLSHDPAVAGIGAQVVANGAQGLAAGTAAAASLTGLAPAGAEEVSAQAAAAFTNEGAQILALNTAAQEELAKAGAAITEIAGIFTAVDQGAADTIK